MSKPSFQRLQFIFMNLPYSFHIAPPQVAQKLGKDKNVVVIIPSNGERYLSTPLYQFE
jgi:hypothetical protein